MKKERAGDNRWDPIVSSKTNRSKGKRKYREVLERESFYLLFVLNDEGLLRE